MAERTLIDQAELGGGGNSSGGTVGGMLNQTFATGGTRALINSLSPESAEERERQRQAIMEQCAASGGYFAAGVCHTGQAAVDVAKRQAESETASSAITDKANNWLEDHADEIDENGKFVGEVTEEQETAAGEVTNVAEEQNVDTATKDADQEAESEDVDVETKDADKDGETALLDIFKDFDGTVITEPPIKDFSDPEALAKDIAEQSAKDAAEQARKDNRTEQQKKDDDDSNTETEQKDKDDAAEKQEKDAQVAEEETKDKDTTAEQAEKDASETEQKDKNITESKVPPEEQEKDAEEAAKDVAEKALKDTTPDDTTEAEQKDKDLTESVNASIGNKDGEDSIGDTTKDGEEETDATKDGEDQSDLNKTKDAEDESGVIATKDTEVISDVIGSKDGENQSDTTKDGETANTKDISNPESELKDPESDKDGETGDLNNKDAETQEQIFQKDAEMSDIATGSKDTETETKDPEGDGAKDGENDLLNLFKGAGVGAMASVPRTVTPFEPLTQRDIRIQAPTMLSDIIRQQDAVAQLNQALAQAMSMPHGDKPSGRALNSLFDSLLNEKAV